jgi:hypothetical protein
MVVGVFIEATIAGTDATPRAGEGVSARDVNQTVGAQRRKAAYHRGNNDLAVLLCECSLINRVEGRVNARAAWGVRAGKSVTVV